MKKFTSNINEMLINGVHLGHKNKRLNKNMKNYIIERKRNDMSFIDLNKTSIMLNKALSYINNEIIKGKMFLIICSKKKFKKLIEYSSKFINVPYINNRWMGGTLTNFEVIKNCILKLKYLKSIIYSKNKYKMKNRILYINIRRYKRYKKFFGGIKDMTKLPDFVFIINSKIHKNAIKEANEMKIPIICIVDSDSSPINIDFPIPGNDDSYKSIIYFLRKISETVISSREIKEYVY